MSVIRDLIEHHKELRALAKDAKRNRVVYPCPVVASNSKVAIWEISVPGMKPCYMKLAATSHLDSYVVRVDAEKFFRAWLEGSGVGRNKAPDDCEPRHRLPEDYKFHWPGRHFPQGIENPVPLADVSIGTRQKGKLSISFADGVTRTKWLIANRAESFPVHIRDRECAELMNKVAGMDKAPIPLDSLFSEKHTMLSPADGLQPAVRQQRQAVTHLKRGLRL